MQIKKSVMTGQFTTHIDVFFFQGRKYHMVKKQVFAIYISLQNFYVINFYKIQ